MIGFVMRNVVLICLAAGLALLLLAAAPALPTAAQSLPPGFRLVLTAPGVELYQKDYPNGTPDFVQVVNFSRGASLKLLHGGITSAGLGKGVYGGDNPTFQKLALEQYWADFAGDNPDAFCVTNGLFFYMPEDPPPLAFPLKVDGALLTDGYGLEEYPDQKLMLEIWPDRLNISALTPAGLHASSAPNIIAGLTEEANKRAKKSVGRTFIGIEDQNGDGRYETLLILNTLTALQEKAAQVLRDFGAQAVMMLDGGGSSQLICRGQSYVASDRLIPQALGIAAGPELPWFGAGNLVTRSLSISGTLPMNEVATLHSVITSSLLTVGEGGQLHPTDVLWVSAMLVPAALAILVLIWKTSPPPSGVDE